MGGVVENRRRLATSGGYLVRASPAQDLPVDIRPKVFATDGAGGNFFDLRAAFGRYAPNTM